MRSNFIESAHVFSLHHHIEQHYGLKADDQRHRSVYMIMTVTLIMAGLFGIFALVNVTLLARYQLHGGWPWPAVLLCSHLLCLAVLFDLHRHCDVQRAALSTVSICAGALIIYIWLHGRNYGAPMFYFVIPIISFYLQGPQRGAAISLLTLMAVVAADTFSISPQSTSNDTALLLLSFLSTANLLIFMTYFYESSRQFAISAAEASNRKLQFANQKLAEVSATDGLTGIANRRRYDEMAKMEWARSVRSGQSLALLLIDVDQFKAYNDNYGHQAGDEALKDVANVLRDHARRPSDLAARYGGEEFVVMITETTAEAAKLIADSIREGVEALGLKHRYSCHGILTVSIGVAVSGSLSTDNLEALLKVADNALYAAKTAGRNRIEIAQP